jgi:hypothetical protein
MGEHTRHTNEARFLYSQTSYRNVVSYTVYHILWSTKSTTGLPSDSSGIQLFQAESHFFHCLGPILDPNSYNFYICSYKSVKDFIQLNGNEVS